MKVSMDLNEGTKISFWIYDEEWDNIFKVIPFSVVRYEGIKETVFHCKSKLYPYKEFRISKTRLGHNGSFKTKEEAIEYRRREIERKMNFLKIKLERNLEEVIYD